MTDYFYPARIASLTNAKKLREEIAALSLPSWTDFDRDASGALHLYFPTPLTTLQKSNLDTVIANHNPSVMTAAQQTAVTEATTTINERQLARDAIQAILDLPNNTTITAGTLKPLVRALRRGLL